MSSGAQISSARRRSLGLLALLCIAIQFKGSVVLSATALILWLTALYLFDQASLQRLWMPRFWLISIVLALGSGMLLGTRDMSLLGVAFSKSGLEAGLVMIMRGGFVFGLASWASRALRAEDIQRVATRIGVARLGTAIPVALRLLPELKDRFHETTDLARSVKGRRRYRLSGIREVAVQLFCHTACLANRMALQGPTAADPLHRATGLPGTQRGSAATQRPAQYSENLRGPRRFSGSVVQRALVAAVVGPPGCGKTTSIIEIVRHIRGHGFQIGGVTQPAIYEGSKRTGYMIWDVATDESRSFAHRGATTRQGLGFAFEPEAWAWASQRLIRARTTMDVVVVDELGLLEAKGEGHMKTLEGPLEDERARLWLVSVRADCAEAIQRQIGPFNLSLTVGSTENPIEDFAHEIINVLGA